MRKIFLYIFALLSLNLSAQNDSWVNVKVQHDYYYDESSWDITDSNGDTVISYAPTTPYEIYEDTLNLDSGPYTLHLHDSWGDGWTSSLPSYVLIENDCQDTIYFEYTNFNFFNLDTVFNVMICGPPVSGCMDPIATNYNPAASISDSSCIYPPCAGLDTLWVETYCDSTNIKVHYHWSNMANPNCRMLAYTRTSDINTLGNNWYAYPANWSNSGIQWNNNQQPNTTYYFLGMLADSSYTDTLVITTGECILGCTDPTSINYNPWANVNNGSCIVPPAACAPGQTNISITVTPDTYPGETSWELVDTTSGSALLAVSPGFYNATGIPVTSNVCVDTATIVQFNIYDTYGDGMCGSCFGGVDGSVLVTSQCGDTLYELVPGNADFGDTTYSAPYLIPNCPTTPPLSGCTDPGYTQYNPLAVIDDGSCITPVILGCVDSTALNYDPNANQQLITANCDYTLRLLDGAGDGWFGSWVGVRQGPTLYGPFTITNGSILDTLLPLDAINPVQIYFFTVGNSITTADQCGVQLINPEGQITFYAGSNPWTDPIIPFPNIYNTLINCGNSCIPQVIGCMDSTAFNYNMNVNVDDGSCYYAPGCTSPAYLEYHSQGFTADFDDGSCITLAEFGCMDPTMFNYNQYATVGWTSATDSTNPCIPIILGCTDPTALNYDPNANTEDYSCILPIYGCTDSTMFNYNPLANTDNGTCIPFIYGCTDPGAINYDPTANTDDFSCIQPIYGCTDSTMFNYDPNANTDNGTCIPFIYGCTNPVALNYDPGANTDDFSCILPIYGCTDSTMFNYNPLANVDNGTCEVFVYGCTDALAANFDPLANTNDNSCYYSPGCTDPLYLEFYSQGFTADFDDGSCQTLVVYGCTDPTMFNYNSAANIDNGSCEPYIYGCTDSTAFNYDPVANTDNGTCIPFIYGCMDQTAFNYDPNANTNQVSVTDPSNPCLPVIYGCTDSTAFNFDPLANTDNNSCIAVILGCTGDYDFQGYLYTTYPNYLPGFGTVVVDNIDPNANTDDGSCLYYDLNTVTGAGTPYWLNDSCYAWVVYEVDPYCLNNAWDPFCQSEYDYCKYGTPMSLENLGREQILVYPNPTRDRITIKTKDKIYVNIYDIIGNSIVNKKDIQEEGQIDLSEFPPGIYNLQINYKGMIINHKVIKQ